MHHKPILYLPFPFLIINTRGLGKLEMPQNPAEHHPHLHQCKILTYTACRAVRKGEKRGRIVFASRCTLAEPPFWYKRIRRVEVTSVSMYAVRVKDDLCPFGDNSAIQVIV